MSDHLKKQLTNREKAEAEMSQKLIKSFTEALERLQEEHGLALVPILDATNRGIIPKLAVEKLIKKDNTMQEVQEQPVAPVETPAEAQTEASTETPAEPTV